MWHRHEGEEIIRGKGKSSEKKHSSEQVNHLPHALFNFLLDYPRAERLLMVQNPLLTPGNKVEPKTKKLPHLADSRMADSSLELDC